MDKEMKAKIDEILKANGKRELSLDEMDQVSGGGNFPSDYRLAGYTAAEAGGMLQLIYETLGIDAAADFACNNITAGNWLGYMQESSSRNAAYYAVDMIWQKAYENEKGKWGGGY